MTAWKVSGGNLDGIEVDAGDGVASLHNPFMGDDFVPMMESYKLVTHPGDPADDGTYPNVTYSWDYDREWTMTSANTYSSPLAHVEGNRVWLRIRIRVAQKLRALAERISPREDDPDYDYGEDW